ncbi:DUF6890 family protein [Serratia rhizosphaerae]
MLRRHWLPHETDSLDSFAAAVWLDNRHYDYYSKAVANGISLAFKGKE